MNHEPFKTVFCYIVLIVIKLIPQYHLRSKSDQLIFLDSPLQVEISSHNGWEPFAQSEAIS